MATNLRDFYLPLLFISILMGYQVIIYFIYQYQKIRKEKLELNKTLIAYILTFGLAFTGYSIRIINIYYIQDFNFELFKMLTKITFIFLFSSLLSYILITSTETFNICYTNDFF